MLLAYTAFAWAISRLSNAPVYQRLAPDLAVLSLSFSHAGQRKAECVRLTAEQIAALPPQQRRPFDCPRERWPLLWELELDGALLHQAIAEAAGIAHDGVATVYENFSVPAGHYDIRVRLRDSARADGFDYEGRAAVDLTPGERFVIDFRVDQSGFVFGAR